MVKHYKSTLTYLPLIYYYISTTLVAFIIHSDDVTLTKYKPYTILFAGLLNTIVYRYYKSKRLIRSILHKQSWKSVTMLVYGILGNLIHEMTFTDHHFSEMPHLISASVLYMFGSMLFGYYYKNDEVLTIWNIFYLLIPIKRNWQISLHAFTIYSSLSLFIMYANCTTKQLHNNTLIKRPLIRYFPYLRVHSWLIGIGFIQLMVEFYQLNTNDAEAEKTIDEALETMPIIYKEEGEEMIEKAPRTMQMNEGLETFGLP